MTVSPPRALWPVLLGIAALTFSFCLYYPGYQSFDSAYQYWQVRTGRFANLSPVVMSALWYSVNAIWPSPAALLTIHLIVYWAGIVLLALQFWDGTLPRLAFVVGAGFLPPAFVIIGHLWTDASLIAAMTLAFGLTVAGLFSQRRPLLVMALPLILYAGAVRHNSLLAIVPLAILWADGIHRGPAWDERSSPVRRRRLVVAAVATLVVASSFGFGRALDQLLVRERVTNWVMIALWDLAGISIRTGTLLVPEFARTTGTSLESVERTYTPFANVPLFDGNGYLRHGLDGNAYSADEKVALAKAWLLAISQHPSSYADHRLAVTSRLFGRYAPGEPEGLFFVPTVVPYQDNPAPESPLWEFRNVYAGYVRSAKGWWIFAPAPYLALAIVILAVGWQGRHTPSGKVAMTSVGSGLLLVLPLTVTAPSAELRYSGWLFTSVAIGIAACSAMRSVRQDRR